MAHVLQQHFTEIYVLANDLNDNDFLKEKNISWWKFNKSLLRVVQLIIIFFTILFSSMIINDSISVSY